MCKNYICSMYNVRTIASVLERNTFGLIDVAKDEDRAEASTEGLFRSCDRGIAGSGNSTGGGVSAWNPCSASLRAFSGGVSPVLPYFLDVRACATVFSMVELRRASSSDTVRGVSLCSSIGMRPDS